MPGKQQPSDIDVALNTGRVAISRFQCSFPAIVTELEAADGRVTVQPAIRIRAASGQQAPPKPVTIPVGWFSVGGVLIQAAFEVGDECIVQCQDKNWNAWLLTGGFADDVAPGGHQSGYAVAMPCQVSVQRRPPPMASTDKLRIGTVDGNTTIIFGKDGSVSVQSAIVSLGLAASPKLAVARDTDPVSVGVAQLTWLNNVGAATMVGAFPSSAIGTVAATSTEVSSS